MEWSISLRNIRKTDFFKLQPVAAHGIDSTAQGLALFGCAFSRVNDWLDAYRERDEASIFFEKKKKG